MKKLLIILTIFLLLTSCSQSKVNDVNTNIVVNKAVLEYREEISLYDLVSIDNGSFISEDTLIDTSKLETKEISFKYKNSKNKKENYSFYVSIVDTTSPIIFNSKKYTVNKGEEFHLLDRVFCGDNYDREISCDMVGEYDTFTVGEYDVKLTSVDSSGNKAETPVKVVVKEREKEENSSSDSTYYDLEDLKKRYKKDNTMIGIDVSSWQEDIDWEKVRSCGIEAAIIRIGFGYDNENYYDKTFRNNLERAKAAGLKVGIYYYSYAASIKEATNQAKWIIEELDGEKLDLPIAFDWEEWSDFDSYKFNFHDINDIANAFMDEVTSAGYKAMNYGSAKYLEKVWDTPKYPSWLAYYTDDNDFEEEFYIWQIASDGKVDGIKGYVDYDIIYIDKEGD